MHELRKDPLLGRWAAVMSNSMSPDEYDIPSENEQGAPCVLCPGYEMKAPREISAVGDLSLTLLSALRKMRKVLKAPPFNYVIHTAPNRIPRRNHRHTLGDDFHWHIEIMPRLLRTSGFEWGSGFYVLTTSPEDAANYLREA